MSLACQNWSVDRSPIDLSRRGVRRRRHCAAHSPPAAGASAAPTRYSSSSTRQSTPRAAAQPSAACGRACSTPASARPSFSVGPQTVTWHMARHITDVLVASRPRGSLPTGTHAASVYWRGQRQLKLAADPPSHMTHGYSGREPPLRQAPRTTHQPSPALLFCARCITSHTALLARTSPNTPVGSRPNSPAPQNCACHRGVDPAIDVLTRAPQPQDQAHLLLRTAHVIAELVRLRNYSGIAPSAPNASAPRAAPTRFHIPSRVQGSQGPARQIMGTYRSPASRLHSGVCRSQLPHRRLSRVIVEVALQLTLLDGLRVHLVHPLALSPRS